MLNRLNTACHNNNFLQHVQHNKTKLHSILVEKVSHTIGLGVKLWNSHSSVGSFANNNTGFVHWVNIMLQSKVCCNSGYRQQKWESSTNYTRDKHEQGNLNLWWKITGHSILCMEHWLGVQNLLHSHTMYFVLEQITNVPMCKHAVIGVPWWKFIRFHPCVVSNITEEFFFKF